MRKTQGIRRSGTSGKCKKVFRLMIVTITLFISVAQNKAFAHNVSYCTNPIPQDSMVLMDVELCKNENCDTLPKDITDCYHCLYNEWDEELKEYTKNLCEEHDIDYSHVLGIIWNESRFKTDIISHMGNTTNYGLMQINSTNFEFLKENIQIEDMKDLLDPKNNILAGVTLLKHHKEYTENDKDAILRYQVGNGNYNQIKNGKQKVPGCWNRVIDKAKEFESII